MTQSSTELEHEVEEQRMRVEEKLTSLRERMSVGQLFDEAGRYVHVDDFSQAARTMGRQVRDNPLALGLVGVGLGWLMLSNGSSHQRDRYAGDRYALPPYDDDDLDEHDTVYATSSRKGKRTMASKIKSAARSTGETIQSAMETGRRGVHDLRDGIVEKGKAAASYASSSSHSGSHSGSHSVSHRSSHGGTRRQIAGQFDSGRRALSRAMDNEPLLMGAMAVAVGVLIGAALPSTRQEDRLMGDTRDDLWDEAKRSGRDLAGKARHVAEETATAAKDAATETAKKSAKKEGLTGSGSQSGSTSSTGSTSSGATSSSGLGATSSSGGSGSSTGVGKGTSSTGTGSTAGGSLSSGSGTQGTQGSEGPSPASGSGINPTRP